MCRRRKNVMLNTIYKMLVVHIGEPPHEFEWTFRDKNNTYVVWVAERVGPL